MNSLSCKKPTAAREHKILMCGLFANRGINEKKYSRHNLVKSLKNCN